MKEKNLEDKINNKKKNGFLKALGIGVLAEIALFFSGCNAEINPICENYNPRKALNPTGLLLKEYRGPSINPDYFHINPEIQIYGYDITLINDKLCLGGGEIPIEIAYYKGDEKFEKYFDFDFVFYYENKENQKGAIYLKVDQNPADESKNEAIVDEVNSFLEIENQKHDFKQTAVHIENEGTINDILTDVQNGIKNGGLEPNNQYKERILEYLK